MANSVFKAFTRQFLITLLVTIFCTFTLTANTISMVKFFWSRLIRERYAQMNFISLVSALMNLILYPHLLQCIIISVGYLHLCWCVSNKIIIIIVPSWISLNAAFWCTDFIINPLNPIVHFWLHRTAHCALVLCQQKGWDRGRWVGSPTGCCAHGGC